MGAIRRHREFINQNVPELLEILMREAKVNKNIEVSKWLVGRILPDPKPITFANANLVNNVETLTELKEQSVQTVTDTIAGETSLEEAEILMNLYKDHGKLIESADIEPLAQELAMKYHIGR